MTFYLSTEVNRNTLLSPHLVRVMVHFMCPTCWGQAAGYLVKHTCLNVTVKAHFRCD